jgi:hypothetical protein
MDALAWSGGVRGGGDGRDTPPAGFDRLLTMEVYS